MNLNVTLKRELQEPKSYRNFEVVLADGDSVYYPITASPRDVDKDKLNIDGIDLITTLSLYYDPKYIEENALCIINDGNLYERTFAELVYGYTLYEYGSKNRWSNDPRVMKNE